MCCSPDLVAKQVAIAKVLSPDARSIDDMMRPWWHRFTTTWCFGQGVWYGSSHQCSVMLPVAIVGTPWMHLAENPIPSIHPNLFPWMHPVAWTTRPINEASCLVSNDMHACLPA